MASKQSDMTRLPVEVLHLVLAFYVATYIEDVIGPRAKITEDEDEGDEQVLQLRSPACSM